VRECVSAPSDKEDIDSGYASGMHHSSASADEAPVHFSDLSTFVARTCAFEARDVVSRHLYRGTSLTRKRTPLGPYRRPEPRVLGGS